MARVISRGEEVFPGSFLLRAVGRGTRRFTALLSP